MQLQLLLLSFLLMPTNSSGPFSMSHPSSENQQKNQQTFPDTDGCSASQNLAYKLKSLSTINFFNLINYLTTTTKNPDLRSDLTFLNPLTSLWSHRHYNPSYQIWTIPFLTMSDDYFDNFLLLHKPLYKAKHMYREQKDYSVFTWCFQVLLVACDDTAV